MFILRIPYKNINLNSKTYKNKVIHFNLGDKMENLFQRNKINKRNNFLGINKKFLATTFTLSGTLMGAGILGLPYVFAKSGFFVGLFWLISLGIMILFVNLSLAEVSLRTRGTHHLPGYAKKYLGIWGERLMFCGMVFGIYSALLAYLIGEGESFSKILPGNINPFILGVAFWMIMTLLLREGLKGLKKIEVYGVIAIILIITGLFIKLFPQIETINLLTINKEYFTFPIGVILFSLLGFTSIPELREEIRGKEKLFKKAVILGTSIPIIVYSIFSLIFVGILGKSVTQVATLSFGPFITILGIFTMLTSFFVLSYSLRDMYRYDFKLSPKMAFFLTSLIPLILYTLISQLNFISFASILGIGGVISGGSTGILILLTNKKSKNYKRNNKDPEIKMPMSWKTIIIISVIFIIGTITEFLN
tara:strand:+ start:8994 stop:10253 length:1260 start_codon:yes stop_codon:yes gene_type:complete